MKSSGHPITAALVAVIAFTPVAASAQPTGKWEYGAALYGYLPTIGGQTTFPPSGGGDSIGVDAETILDKLKMTFMGSFEASNGRWGVFTDLVYFDVGDSRSNTQSFSIGRVGIPAGVSASVDYDLKGWMWGIAGTYRVATAANHRADLLAGARALNVRQRLRWTLAGDVGPIALADRAGTREADDQNWDAIVGMRGRVALGDGRWFVPYYVDVGTGESKSTWQAMAGVGYSFGWGDVVGAWRYIDYRMKSGSAVEELNFSGPSIAAVFHW
jgi:hypothetical protein